MQSPFVMPIHHHSIWTVIALGGLLLAGCAVPSKKQRPASSDAAGLPPAEAGPTNNSPAVLTPGELESRAEAHARYAAAIIHELNEEPEQAADELYQAALNDLGNESLVLDVTRRLLQFKKNDKALDLLQKATARPDASGLVYARLGLVYALGDKKQEAIEANRVAIKKIPRSIVGYQNLARLHIQANESEEVLRVLDEAAKQSDVDAAFLIDLSEMYSALALSSSAQNAEAKKQAMAMLERAAKLNPTNPVQLQKMGDGFALLGAAEKAEEVYRKLLERFPNLPGLREKLAEIYLRGKDRDKAREQLEAIIRNTPTNPQAHYFLGGIEFEQRKWKEAAEHYQSAILVSPSFEPAYYDLALTQINANTPREALSTLEKAKKRFKETFTSEFYAAIAYGKMKEYSNATARFTAAEVIGRATETKLTHVFYYHMGGAFERVQNYEEAERYLKKSLELAPDFSEAMNYLGYMWAERGVNLQEARVLIEKAVKAEPKNAAYLDSLAWVFFKLDQPKEALAWMLKAIEHSEEPDATLYDHLGDIYAALKDTSKAQEAWKKSVEIEPKDEVKKKLEAAAGPSGGESAP